MRMYKCDRCKKLVEPSERFPAHINGMTADLCPVCYEEFRKDEELADSMYQKNVRAISIKYGFTSISEIIRLATSKEDK